jgi:hypothetical protein
VHIDITHTLELEHTTLSISRSTVSLRDLFVLQNSTNIARISFFLSSLYNARTFEYFFSIYEFSYLHQNLTHTFWQLFPDIGSAAVNQQSALCKVSYKDTRQTSMAAGMPI